MEALLLNFGELLSQNIWLAFIMALVAGLISSFSPCVLSAIPLIIGYVGGYAGDDQKRALKFSLLFCSGLVLTFTALGAASALLGKMMTGAGKWWYLLLALIMAAAGLQLLGIFQFRSSSCRMPSRREGLLGAFLLGIVGGISSSGFDCSGLVKHVYSIHGINLPRVACDQANAGTKIWSMSQLQVGDIVCFSGKRNGYVDHVGIYIGSNQIIHASSSAGRVVVSSLSGNWYQQTFVHGVRVL
jgi:hypothetical protein